MVGSLATQGAIDGALVSAVTAWKVCDREKRGLVEAVDAFNAAAKPKKPFWKVW